MVTLDKVLFSEETIVFPGIYQNYFRSIVRILSTSLVATWCMSKITSQNLLACPIISAHCISRVMNGLKLILTNKLLDYVSNVEHCGANQLMPNWSWTKHTIQTHMAHVLFPEFLCLNCQCLGFSWIFSQLYTHFLFHSRISCEIAIHHTTFWIQRY